PRGRGRVQGRARRSRVPHNRHHSRLAIVLWNTRRTFHIALSSCLAGKGIPTVLRTYREPYARISCCNHIHITGNSRFRQLCSRFGPRKFPVIERREFARKSLIPGNISAAGEARYVSNRKSCRL